MKKTANPLSKTTRTYRNIHKWIALPTFAFLFIIGTTGLLLGWKKQLQLLPKTHNGQTLNSEKWLHTDSIYKRAAYYSKEVLKKDASIDRMDIRPSKGVVKILFENHFTELQLDLATGEVLSVSNRTSDFIEKLHDGSIIDYYIGTPNDEVKLFYTSSVSVGLILLSFTGFWLWYNPKRIRKQKHSLN
ncbi:MAG: peptidase [Flavobacteriales bacterium CG_4_9_14_3_um_filter_40_17]|nr:MAG: peptidase [Flavobacteriales bacterium CG_4_9_14_3_um_filter_40_17]